MYLAKKCIITSVASKILLSQFVEIFFSTRCTIACTFKVSGRYSKMQNTRKYQLGSKTKNSRYQVFDFTMMGIHEVKVE